MTPSGNRIISTAKRGPIGGGFVKGHEQGAKRVCRKKPEGRWVPTNGVRVLTEKGGSSKGGNGPNS